jgi:hypothetical protein
VIYKRVFNVPPKSSLLRGCRGELEIAKGHRIARLIREETKMSPDSQLPNQSFPSNRPVNGVFQWLALLGVALAVITAIKLLW